MSPAIYVSLVHIIDFLDIRSLALFEQTTSLDASVRAGFWKKAVDAAIESIALWGPAASNEVNKIKEDCNSWGRWLQQLRLLQRTVFASKAWKPWITSESFCCLKFVPHDLDAPDVRRIHAVTTRELNEQFGWEHGALRPEVPRLAAIPVSVGAYLGQSLVIGMRLDAEAPFSDDLCIGIEVCGCCRSMSVMMAPFSGHFYMQYSTAGPTMWTSGLGKLDSPGRLQVWLQVFENGAIRFLRQAEGNAIEDAGIMPTEWFPAWGTSYFACAYCWYQTLRSSMTLSVDYAEDRLPLGVSETATEMDTVWSRLEED
eukprot:TRINITY_DN63064_c0_g1_i1.p1 TRINITY_DN63064_c0_g1~~TRINITY_DN63064_c0_g1_i1.p1  ORF type:complete len:331 (+),score=39.85 TRINITY_DN63064_c0_g1_i1:56-994(+)